MLFPTLLSISQSQTWDFKEFVSKPNFLECLLLKKHHFRVYLKKLGLHYSRNTCIVKISFVIIKGCLLVTSSAVTSASIWETRVMTNPLKWTSSRNDAVVKRSRFSSLLIKKIMYQRPLRFAYSLLNISISIGSFDIQVDHSSVFKLFWSTIPINYRTKSISLLDQNHVSYLMLQRIHLRIL